jgi:hypothetical protein
MVVKSGLSYDDSVHVKESKIFYTQDKNSIFFKGASRHVLTVHENVRCTSIDAAGAYTTFASPVAHHVLYMRCL